MRVATYQRLPLNILHIDIADIGNIVQAKFPSGDLGFSASLSPLLLLGLWLDPESYSLVVCGFGFGVFSHLLVLCWVSGVLWVSLPGAWSLLAQPSALLCSDSTHTYCASALDGHGVFSLGA